MTANRFTADSPDRSFRCSVKPVTVPLRRFRHGGTKLLPGRLLMKRLLPGPLLAAPLLAGTLLAGTLLVALCSSGCGRGGAGEGLSAGDTDPAGNPAAATGLDASANPAGGANQGPPADPVLATAGSGSSGAAGPGSPGAGRAGGEGGPLAAGSDRPEPQAAGELRPLPVPEEQWSVIQMDGNPVGHSHFRSQWREQDGQRLVQLDSTLNMTIKRFGQTVTQEIRLSSLETEDGQVRSCRCEVRAGPVASVTEGEVRDGRMHLATTTAGKTTNSTLAWEPHFTGFFGAELSPRRQPLQPGETRTVATLLPMFNQVAEVRLEAGQTEATELPDGSQSLLRVASLLQIGPNRIESVMWLDSQGRTVKSLVPGIKQVTYLTSREEALRSAGVAEFDLGTASVVRVSQPLAQPHQTRKVVYVARLTDGQVADLFVQEGGQTVRKLDDRTVELTVRAIGPDEPAELERPGEPPTKADLDANNQIQSDDPAVMAMASEVAGDEQDPWKLACALETHVSRSIRSKNFSQAFATAAEVVVSREGDCTEHAVLLAALCRARKIPARVAIGLVYYPAAQGFAYHMWNEVWVGGRWVPLDATLNLGGIGAAHLKLVHSNLEGADALSAFLPVFRVLGQLQLEIQSVE